MKESLFIAIALLAVACAGRENAVEEPVQATTQEVGRPAQEVQQETLTMELEGVLSPTVEAGGWVLETPQGTYLLLNISEHRKEPWFKEGARVKVTGKESPDTITIFMQGTPFTVESMEPAGMP